MPGKTLLIVGIPLEGKTPVLTTPISRALYKEETCENQAEIPHRKCFHIMPHRNWNLEHLCSGQCMCNILGLICITPVIQIKYAKRKAKVVAGGQHTFDTSLV